MPKTKEKEIDHDVSADQMTMRDIFAGFAIAAYFSDGEGSFEDACRWCYRVADAMLKERSK